MKVILTETESKLLTDCIMIYGTDAQLEQYAEECLEAALAVRKFLRAKKHGDVEELLEKRKELCGEIIDTTLMSIQMKNSMMSEEQFKEIWDYKVNRQIGRVNKKLNVQKS